MCCEVFSTFLDVQFFIGLSIFAVIQLDFSAVAERDVLLIVKRCDEAIACGSAEISCKLKVLSVLTTLSRAASLGASVSKLE